MGCLSSSSSVFFSHNPISARVPHLRLRPAAHSRCCKSSLVCAKTPVLEPAAPTVRLLSSCLRASSFPPSTTSFSASHRSTMQGVGSFLMHGRRIKTAVMQHLRVATPLMRPALFQRFESSANTRMEEHGFESTTIANILKGKGEGADGSWLWCTVEDTVYDVVKSMTQHNVGALVVVKPGEQKSIAGIITERVQGRSSKSTKVGDIMTEENKLITVSPTTKVLKAMQLMTCH